MSKAAYGYDVPKIVIPLKNLLKIMRALKEDPSLKVDATIPGWFEDLWESERFWAWFMACLHNKINRKVDLYRVSLREDENGVPRTKPWRNYTPEGYGALQHDRKRVEEYYQHRIRHSGCRNLLHSRYMKRRYPHIDNQPSDD